MKWGKEKFDAVELNTEEPPMVFKAQLFALTGVQPDRQKVMVKGGTLKVGTHVNNHQDSGAEVICKQGWSCKSHCNRILVCLPIVSHSSLKINALY